MKKKLRSLQVVNKTKEVALGWRVEVADSFRARLVGLLGRAGLPEGGGLLLTPCSSIHSFLMEFTLDALFLNGDGQVVLALSEIGPGRIIKPVAGAVQVLELPAGLVKASGTDIGDKLVFCENSREDRARQMQEEFKRTRFP
jgi:uncharacterized membrane protein (UPF0127 family)